MDVMRVDGRRKSGGRTNYVGFKGQERVEMDKPAIAILMTLLQTYYL